MNDSSEDRDASAATATEGGRASASHGARQLVIIVSYHFYPSPEVGAKRMTALAEHLAAQGNEVAVISAFEGLEKTGEQENVRQKLSAFRVVRVPHVRSRMVAALVRAKARARRLLSATPREGARDPSGGASGAENERREQTVGFRDMLFSLLHSIDDTKRWSVQAGRQIATVAADRRPGVVIVSGPPMSPLGGAIHMSRRLRVPIIVDLRDPLRPDLARDCSALQRWDAWTRSLLERYVVPRADAVTTTSNKLRDQLRDRYPSRRDRIACIPNGFDGQPAAARAGTDHRLVMVYAGALYLNRNPFPFLEALERLLAEPGVDAARLEVVLAGECEHYGGTSLRTWLASRACRDIVTIEGRLGAPDLRRLYDRATLLINFAEGQPMQVPAKTFELLALGREMLILCEPDSETARIVAGLAGVVRAVSTDREGLQKALRDLYARHVVEGRLAAPSPQSISRHSRAASNEQFHQLIWSVIGKRVGHARCE